MKKTPGILVKRLVTGLAVILLFAASGSAQTKRKSAAPEKQPAYNYYFDITRPSCCDLSKEKWQQIAKNLNAKGINAFFGIYETTRYVKIGWKSVRLTKTTADGEGWLILGPFASEAVAKTALGKLTKLLPNNNAAGEEDERTGGLGGGATTDPQTWRIGMYEINGFKTKEPVQTQKPKVLSAGIIKGVIVENTGGANWVGVIVESGGVKYLVQLSGSSGGVKTQTGDVETIGNRVRIAFKDKEKMPDGGYFLKATSITQLK